MAAGTASAFISYSREESEFALRLAGDLRKAGARIWLDQLDIVPGRPWDSAIETALLEASTMLLILSPASVQSENVRNEISFALEEGKTILPILHRDCGVPLRLHRLQRVDFRTDYARGLNEVLLQLDIGPREEGAAQAAEPGIRESLPAVNNQAPQERRRIRIAMVPVEHLGGAADDYFAAGLTDDMISALSRIDPVRLRVTAGPRLVGTELLDQQLDRLQRELDLDYLLRGSVRRSADTIRISAQLHDLRDKSVLWSESYDRKSSDLLAVQEEVTMRVSQSLALELLPNAAVGTRRYAGSSLAYDAYLKGRFFWHKMTSDAIRSSITYFTEAITIDPGFAPAYAGMADCYLQMGSVRVATMQPMDALAKARPLLDRAMQLDDSMAEAHCTLGLMKCWYDLDWAGAERAFQTAIKLDGSHLTTLLWQSLYLSAMGRHEEAIASVKRARESEPLSQVVNMYLGVALFNAGQLDLSVRQLQQAIELDPHYYRPYLFLGRTYSALQKYDDAIAAYRQGLVLNPENLEAVAYLGQTLAEQGDRKGALSALKKLRAAAGRTEPALLAAFVYAGLHDEDEMLRSLERAREKKCVPLYAIRMDNSFRRYDREPRFQEFLRSIGLPFLDEVREIKADSKDLGL